MSKRQNQLRTHINKQTREKPTLGGGFDFFCLPLPPKKRSRGAVPGELFELAAGTSSVKREGVSMLDTEAGETTPKDMGREMELSLLCVKMHRIVYNIYCIYNHIYYI